MYRSVTYKLQPTSRQLASIEQLFEIQRELWNAALEERRAAWALKNRQINRYDQFAELADLRVLREDLAAFGICVARGTLTRLDLAYSAFFRRVRAGERPGHPRFRGRGRFSSVSWPDTSGWKLHEGQKRVNLMGVGHVRLRLRRRLPGTPKTATLRRVGQRYELTVFCANVPLRPLEPTGRVVGIDLGVSNLLATSDGELVAMSALVPSLRRRSQTSNNIEKSTTAVLFARAASQSALQPSAGARRAGEETGHTSSHARSSNATR